MKTEDFADYKSRIPWGEIDANVVDLIKVLNSLQGVATLASCGGHAGRLKPGQWEKGRWFVGLIFARDLSGWQAFDAVALALNDLDDLVTLSPFVNAVGTTSFTLIGEDYDPKKFARRLQEAVEDADEATSQAAPSRAKGPVVDSDAKKAKKSSPGKAQARP